MTNSLNTPPSVAPMISGLLLIRWDWRAIFWFLTISSATVLAAIVVFLPETCRRIVGNGSLPAPPITNTAIITVLSAHKTKRAAHEVEEGITIHSSTASENNDPSTSTPRASGTNSKQGANKPGGFSVFNPFTGLALVFGNRGTTVAVCCYAIYYMLYSCLQASLSSIFVDIYNVSGLVAGLSYIPFGVACIIASTFAGT